MDDKDREKEGLAFSPSFDDEELGSIYESLGKKKEKITTIRQKF